MLDRRSNYRAPIAAGANRAGDCEIVGFRPAAAKDDLRRRRPDQRGNAGARLLQELARMLSRTVHRGWIARGAVKDRRDRFTHFRPQWSARVMVEIDSH